MSDIWVTSDTHFNHANILTFEDRIGKPVRSFSSVEEMNETMIANWNSVVKPGDKIYHLGDVFFGSKEWMHRHWSRLNGRKRLVFGNHDDSDFLVKGGFFDKTALWRVFKDFNLLLTHVPVHDTTVHEKRFGGRPTLNVHGHIHQNASPSKYHHCVCVEQTNYTPVHIDELTAIARKL